MTETEAGIAAQYGRTGDLLDRILAFLAGSGVAEGEITAEHLKPLDEFHIGGAAATERLLDPLGLAPGTRILDIGCGIGGPARLMASRYGAKVTGIDLTPDFVRTARRLSALTGLDTAFVEGSALDLPFAAARFDLATLLHVGMNVPDKPRLFAEAARVLRSGGTFALYDVMLHGAPPAFPVPWAETPALSFLAAPDAYLAAAEAAGFRLAARRGRGDAARAFFAEMRARSAAEGPQAIGLPLLMGPTAPAKVANLAAAVELGDIEPVEMIFVRD